MATDSEMVDYGHTQRTLLADFSLAIVNRTGAYYICKDILDAFGDRFRDIYYWRLRRRSGPEGLTRKFLARLMLQEYLRLGASAAFQIGRDRSGGARTVFFDPLYVLRTTLTRDDVVLCHDVGPITHGWLFDPATVALYEKAYAKISEARPGVVFVSEFSRNGFVGLYGSDYRFLEVIPLYARPMTAKPAAPAEKPPSPYLLAVGGLEVRKNYERTLDAFAASGLAASHSFVIAGPRGNAAEAVAGAVERTEGAHLMGAVSDATLAWLYANADGFVLPSLLEGFGVPVIEAAANGVVSVVSGHSAQHEALGGHAILVDPENQDDIMNGMKTLVSMPQAERAALAAAAKAHSDTLSRERFLSSWGALLDREAA